METSKSHKDAFTCTRSRNYAMNQEKINKDAMDKSKEIVQKTIYAYMSSNYKCKKLSRVSTLLFELLILWPNDLFSFVVISTLKLHNKRSGKRQWINKGKK
ncbi:hypothetical protein YC2023_115724 [Brassica napus]